MLRKGLNYLHVYLKQPDACYHIIHICLQVRPVSEKPCVRR